MTDDAASLNRRLAAIIAADIAGDSRLMNEDEAATVRAVLPLVGQDGGRVIDAGNGILAEFPSVTECALEIQSASRALDRERAGDGPVTGRRARWARRTLACALGLTLGLAWGASANAPAVDMTEVRRLAREPVETIFSGVSVGRVSDKDYRTMVNGSPRPVVVVFYANQDEKSRNLATLARYLALEFDQVISFYGYQVTPGAKVEREALGTLQKQYGVKQVPATLFYDNDRGKIELEKTDYSVPTFTEYRTPSMLLWRTYRQAVREYIRKSILD